MKEVPNFDTVRSRGSQVLRYKTLCDVYLLQPSAVRALGPSHGPFSGSNETFKALLPKGQTFVPFQKA